MKNLFRNLIGDLVQPLESEDPDRKSWEETCKQVVNKVINHKRQVRAQVETLLPTERMTEFQKMNIQLQQQALNESKEARKQKEEYDKKLAWAEAKTRLQNFRDDYSVLVAEMGIDQTDWEDRDDPTISKNMQELKEWKKMFQRIVTNFREYEKIIEIYGEESDEQLSVAKDEFMAVKESFEKAKEKIITANRVREIYADQPRGGRSSTIQSFLELQVRIISSSMIR